MAGLWFTGTVSLDMFDWYVWYEKSDFTGTVSLDMLKVFVRLCYADLLHKLRTLGIFV